MSDQPIAAPVEREPAVDVRHVRPFRHAAHHAVVHARRCYSQSYKHERAIRLLSLRPAAAHNLWMIEPSTILNGKILVVDDQELTALVLTELLQTAGLRRRQLLRPTPAKCAICTGKITTI